MSAGAKRNRGRPPAGARLVLGALAGLTGAACMDLVRFSARRARLIDRRIPEEVTRRLTRAVGASRGGGVAGIAARAALERALHLGYGATLGGAFAALAPGPSVGKGALFGVASWVLGSGLVLPGLRVRRPFWKASAAENAVDLTAHLFYGVVTTLGLTELLVEENGGSANPPPWSSLPHLGGGRVG